MVKASIGFSSCTWFNTARKRRAKERMIWQAEFRDIQGSQISGLENKAAFHIQYLQTTKDSEHKKWLLDKGKSSVWLSDPFKSLMEEVRWCLADSFIWTKELSVTLRVFSYISLTCCPERCLFQRNCGYRFWSMEWTWFCFIRELIKLGGRFC